MEDVLRIIDRAGQRYGKLVVISRAANKSPTDTNARWNCKCDCGNETVAYGGDLGRGRHTSCGCLNVGRAAAMSLGNVTHGMTNTRIYRIWNGMLNRCRNKRNQNWANYGGRGVTVCERWMRFENFVSDMGIPEDGMTLDRIDNGLGYSKENCRWSTSQIQACNRRNSRKLTHNGITLTIAEWARALGISVATMHGRVAAGFPPDKLFGPKLK